MTTSTTANNALRAASTTANELVGALYQEALDRVQASQQSNQGPADPAVWEHYELAGKALGVTIDALLNVVAKGGTIHTHDGPVIVADLDYRDGEVVVTATSDGKIATTGLWHRGPEAGLVQYVKWTVADGVADRRHGYVDSKSRLLVQTG